MRLTFLNVGWWHASSLVRPCHCCESDPSSSPILDHADTSPLTRLKPQQRSLTASLRQTKAPLPTDFWRQRSPNSPCAAAPRTMPTSLLRNLRAIALPSAGTTSLSRASRKTPSTWLQRSNTVKVRIRNSACVMTPLLTLRFASASGRLSAFDEVDQRVQLGSPRCDTLRSP